MATETQKKDMATAVVVTADGQETCLRGTPAGTCGEGRLAELIAQAASLRERLNDTLTALVVAASAPSQSSSVAAAPAPAATKDTTSHEDDGGSDDEDDDDIAMS